MTDAFYVFALLVIAAWALVLLNLESPEDEAYRTVSTWIEEEDKRCAEKSPGQNQNKPTP